MANMTYYVAMPFKHDETGDLVVGEPREACDAGQAIRYADVFASSPENCGAVAFARTGDPSLGDFDDAKILKTFGEVDMMMVGG